MPRRRSNIGDSTCINNGNDSKKKIPKAFQGQTSTSDDGYPKYRRGSPHEGGFKATVRNHGIDNSTLQ